MTEYLDPIPMDLPPISDAEYDALITSRAITKPRWEIRPHENPALKHVNAHCVTCKGKGSFLWLKDDEPTEFICPCLDQWTLNATFESCGINAHMAVLGIADAAGIGDGSIELFHDILERDDRIDDGLILVGVSNSGKTLLASLIQRSFLARGLTTYITRVDDMRDDATKAFSDDEDAKKVVARYERKVRNVDLLVVDQMEKVGKTSDFMVNNFTRIVNRRRAQRRPTLLISQQDSAWLATKYYDAAGLIQSMEVHKMGSNAFNKRADARYYKETLQGVTRPRMLI